MQHYVLGFLFSPGKEKVVLIKKEKPSWQRGLMNGVGGKIEEGESSYEAMVREFQEETGVTIHYWKQVGSIQGDWGMVHVFCEESSNYEFCSTQEKEEIVIVDVDQVKYLPVISNLNWLIPMCLDPQSVNDFKAAA